VGIDLGQYKSLRSLWDQTCGVLNLFDIGAMAPHESELGRNLAGK